MFIYVMDCVKKISINDISLAGILNSTIYIGISLKSLFQLTNTYKSVFS